MREYFFLNFINLISGRQKAESPSRGETGADEEEGQKKYLFFVIFWDKNEESRRIFMANRYFV